MAEGSEQPQEAGGLSICRTPNPEPARGSFPPLRRRPHTCLSCRGLRIRVELPGGGGERGSEQQGGLAASRW